MNHKSTEKLWVPDRDFDEYQHDLRQKRNSRIFKFILFGILAFCVLYFLLFVDRANLAKSFGEKTENEGKEWNEMNEIDFESVYEEYSDQFKDYMKRYKREYESGEETLDRFKNYMKNVKEAEKMTKEKKYGAEFGENEMSDWTDEEFKKILLPVNKKRSEKSSFIRSNPPKLETGATLPDFFDWRAKNGVSPVKAQGKCGSCWAFAATATVESAWLVKDGQLRNLSEQTLLDCDLSNNACDGGDEDKAFRFIHRQGLAFSADLPYVAHRQNHCEVADKNLTTTKIEVAYYLHQDEFAMRQWIVNYGPVNVGMSVTQPMRSYKCNSTECGVFTPDADDCKNKVIGLHALLAVGYGTDKKTNEDYWIIKNSWGADWGDHGFIKFRRGINACGIEDEPVGIMA